MEKIKKGYYFFYYTIYRTWNKDPHILFSDSFRTDIIILATKMWFLGIIDTYLCIILNKSATDIISSPKVSIAFILVLFTTLYFFTFSDKKKSYFKKFDKLSKRKKQIGSVIVWSIVVFIFINLFISVELMKKFNE